MAVRAPPTITTSCCATDLAPRRKRTVIITRGLDASHGGDYAPSRHHEAPPTTRCACRADPRPVRRSRLRQELREPVPVGKPDPDPVRGGRPRVHEQLPSAGRGGPTRPVRGRGFG